MQSSALNRVRPRDNSLPMLVAGILLAAAALFDIFYYIARAVNNYGYGSIFSFFSLVTLLLLIAQAACLLLTRFGKLPAMTAYAVFAAACVIQLLHNFYIIASMYEYYAYYDISFTRIIGVGTWLMVLLRIAVGVVAVLATLGIFKVPLKLPESLSKNQSFALPAQGGLVVAAGAFVLLAVISFFSNVVSLFSYFSASQLFILFATLAQYLGLALGLMACETSDAPAAAAPGMGAAPGYTAPAGGTTPGYTAPSTGYTAPAGGYTAPGGMPGGNLADQPIPPELMQETSIAMAIVLSFVTCGIYSWIWIYQLCRRSNLLKGNYNSFAGEYLCIMLVPFYGFYWLYTRGVRLKSDANARGYQAADSGVLYLILAILGFSIVSYALMQNEYNQLARKMQAGIKDFTGTGGFANGYTPPAAPQQPQQPPVQAQPAAPAAQEDSSVEARLLKLGKLKELGLVSDEEYEQKKKQILEDM